MAPTKSLKSKKTSQRAKAIAVSTRAGLLFQAPRFVKVMKRDRLAKSVGKLSAIAMAAACEYLCSEVLELAGGLCQEAKKRRIVPRHIMLAIS